MITKRLGQPERVAGTPSRPKPPWPVKAAVAISVLVALYGLVNFAILLARMDWARYTAPAAVHGKEIATSGVLAVAVLFYLLSAVWVVVVPLWFSWAVIRGHRWARIAVGVYAGVEVAITFATSRFDIGSVLTVFQVLAAILLWLPSANTFFSEYRARFRKRDAERGLTHGIRKGAV